MRAIDDAEERGKIPGIFAGPLRSLVEDIPLEEGIKLIQDGKDLFSSAESFLGPLGDLLNEFLP